MNKQKPHCVVVTCFDEHQPGFLDFSYRIAALAKEYQLTVMSQFLLPQNELNIGAATQVVLGRGRGKLGWLCYLTQCAFKIRQLKPNFVMLLHSSASPISLMVGKIPTCLYWNEHPTNLMRTPTQFSPVRHSLARLFQRILFWGARHASLVMPIGEDHADDLRRHGVTRMKMLYMGVHDHFAPTSDSAVLSKTDTLHMIYVGTISALRGRDVMLNAMAKLAEAKLPVHLTMVGATQAELSYCNEKIAVLGLDAHLAVLGRVPGSEVPSLLRRVDAGICLWEATPWTQFNPPTKLFEYLVAGLPVLASNIRTHTRYVKDGENGWVFDYDADALAHAITRLYLQRAQLPALKLAAAHSGQVHIWSRIEPMFMHEIKQLLNAS